MRFRFAIVLLCFAAMSGCGGSGASGSSGGNAAPTLRGTPENVAWQEESYVFAPQASDGDGDALLFQIDNVPSWASFDAATGRLTGKPSLLDVGTYPGIRIGVTDGQHEVWLPAFDVTVRPVSNGTVTLTWEPPSENTDDSPLEDLSGFKIYWGSDPEDPENVVTVPGADVTEHHFDGLTPGTYYFETTAVNALGIESEKSDFSTIRVH